MMHYVILATHSAGNCPTANAAVRAMLKDTAPKIPDLAKANGVTITAGPYANRDHLVVMCADAESMEGLDKFLAATRLEQFNSLRILPSLDMQQAMAELDDYPALF